MGVTGAGLGAPAAVLYRLGVPGMKRVASAAAALAVREGNDEPPSVCARWRPDAAAPGTLVGAERHGPAPGFMLN